MNARPVRAVLSPERWTGWGPEWFRCQAAFCFQLELMCIRCVVNPEPRSSPYVGEAFWKRNSTRVERAHENSSGAILPLDFSQIWLCFLSQHQNKGVVSCFFYFFIYCVQWFVCLFVKALPVHFQFVVLLPRVVYQLGRVTSPGRTRHHHSSQVDSESGGTSQRLGSAVLRRAQSTPKTQSHRWVICFYCKRRDRHA